MLQVRKIRIPLKLKLHAPSRASNAGVQFRHFSVGFGSWEISLPRRTVAYYTHQSGMLGQMNKNKGGNDRDESTNSECGTDDIRLGTNPFGSEAATKSRNA